MQSRRFPLTLALLVPLIGRADHVDASLAADDLAVLTNALNARTDFHDNSCPSQRRGNPARPERLFRAGDQMGVGRRPLPSRIPLDWPSPADTASGRDCPGTE